MIEDSILQTIHDLVGQECVEFQLINHEDSTYYDYRPMVVALLRHIDALTRGQKKRNKKELAN